MLILTNWANWAREFFTSRASIFTDSPIGDTD
jgi:hypothetical protein